MPRWAVELRKGRGTIEFNDLTSEEQEMANGKSPEEIFGLAKKLGRKLLPCGSAGKHLAE